MRKLSDLLWDATWNVLVFNVKLGRRVLLRLDRATTPTAEGAASSTAQSRFESEVAHSA